MIKNWTIENFKIFRGENSIDFSGITVLSGKNSSGKTSVIQTILLFSQSAQRISGDSEDIFTDNSARFILNGPLVRLGDYSDIANFKNNEQANRISFTFTLDDHDANKNIKLPDDIVNRKSENIFRYELKKSTQNNNDLYDSLHPVVSNFCYTRNVENSEGIVTLFDDLNIDIVRKTHGRKYILDESGAFYGRGADNYRITSINSVFRDDVTGRLFRDDLKKAEIIGVNFSGLFPEYFAVKNEKSESYFDLIQNDLFRPYRSVARAGVRTVPDKFREAFLDTITKQDIFSEDEKSIFRKYLGDDFQKSVRGGPPSFRRDIRQSFSENRDKILRSYRRKVGNWYGVDMRRSNLAQPYFRSAERFFTIGVRYLGPLRDDPKPLYPVGFQRTPDDLGVRGEFTAAVLDRFKDQPVSYIEPKNIFEKSEEPKITKETLQFAVRKWLQHLEVAEDVQTHDLGKLGHELKIKTMETGKFHDLTNVGVGVSQVLPIIILCLIAPWRACVIIEQPELHLHPAVCAKLADFFISMNKIGKQCVIESHGQHIIERLRLRIVEGVINTKDLSVHFFEGGKSEKIVREVEFNEYGNPIEWPLGFFDETQISTEKLLEASSKKFMEK